MTTPHELPEIEALKNVALFERVQPDDSLETVASKLIVALYRVVGIAHNDLENAPAITAKMMERLARTARFERPSKQ